ncbi:hypothetical protein POVCU2_0019430 [Plasmodium ovale curtisi]|uniref:Uncharacterized protein n=1 Tax=Plasmodium ovale curtisi TaxID=864141 RepID=A0A1A8VU31_PLAOA|nr:hypothetical protein POVCU2_0019430 [Plasmodium ovale curtisi]SBS90027.1 hypothetical protein POVCU1_017410 [Plasmodium ovale curtisi]
MATGSSEHPTMEKGSKQNARNDAHLFFMYRFAFHAKVPPRQRLQQIKREIPPSYGVAKEMNALKQKKQMHLKGEAL